MGGEHKVVVVGAGISGLTVAFHLSRAGSGPGGEGGPAPLVLEASGAVGGAIQTLRRDGWTFEQGPNTVLSSRPAVGQLLSEAGLEPVTLFARPASKRRYLWKGDRLQPLPGSPPSFLTTRLFSVGAKLRLLKEPWIGRPPEGTEESIAAFVRRRLGQEFLDYAVGPFVSGVYAGDPERLSVRWAVSRIWSLEHEHGSLIRGALARRKGPQPGGGMISMREGLEMLPRRLARAIEQAGGRVRTGVRCRTIERSGDGDGFRITLEGETGETGETIEAEQVVLAVPADAAAALLGGLTAGASAPIAEIPYAPVVVASYGFPRASVRHPLDGFGFLAPRKESLTVLGCLFPSSLFPDRAPEDHVALAAFAGGRTNPQLLELDDEALHRTMLGDLNRAVGLTGAPVFRELRRWPRAIPQYEVGHGRFVELAARIEAEHPGLYLSGNWTGGVSVPDCIQTATELAERMVAERRAPSPRATAAV